MRHQRRDDYWKHGSICENYADIEIPVFAVSGWQDGYTNAVFRLLEHLPNESKGLVGPWAHEYPEVATPEPNIGFLQECFRWWDQWLKGKDTGIMDEPKLISWIQNSELPEVTYEKRPGKWVGDESWPSKNVQGQKLWLKRSRINYLKRTEADAITIPSMQEHGFYSGVFCPFGQPGDFPADQRLENGKSVVFTSEPLEETVDLFGQPFFMRKFPLIRKMPCGCSLSDKAPTGESTLISWGMLNLNHWQSHEHPEALVPGKKYKVAVKLDVLGQQIPKGHLLEVALSPTYWPQAWPSPKPVTLTVYPGESTRNGITCKRTPARG